MVANLFDANFYRSVNSDLAGFNDAQALSHFQTFGLNEGRQFSPLANLNFYRASNSDLASLDNRQLLEHLQSVGVNEGREFSPFADLGFYRTNNSDLASLDNSQLLEHLQSVGVNEGREFSPFADLDFYRANNSDLSGFNNRQLLEHLQIFGVNEGRLFSPFADLSFYRASNSDLSGFNNSQLLEHLEIFGVNESRQFSRVIEPSLYRNRNADLAAAGLNNEQLLEHFEIFGVNEGRVGSAFFDVNFYLANNADLRAAGFNNEQALEHFVAFGFQEGRPAIPSGPVPPVPPVPPIPPVTPPGSPLASAINAGNLAQPTSFTDSVSSVDTDDFYSFNLAGTSDFRLQVSGLSANADVQLIRDSNNNGVVDAGETFVTGDNTNPFSGENISRTLGAGTYFARVFRASGTDTSYTLNLSLELNSSVSPPSDPGSSLPTALNVGTLTLNPSSFTDFVSSVDTDDFYSFNLAGTSDFRLQVSGLSANADVQLIRDSNNNGVVDAGETFVTGDNTNPFSGENISRTLGAGTYFARVFRAGGTDTNYTLNLSAEASLSVSPPSDPGSSLSTALNIGTVSFIEPKSFTDFLSSGDTDDFYSFNLASTNVFRLQVSGLSANADVQLIQDSNNNGVLDASEILVTGNNTNPFSGENINRTLMAGTYFARVFRAGSTDTNYTLGLTVQT